MVSLRKYHKGELVITYTPSWQFDSETHLISFAKQQTSIISAVSATGLVKIKSPISP